MKNESGASVGAGCLLAIIGIVVSTVVRGYTLAILWSWFIVTTLHASPLSIAQALGISLVVGTFLPTKTDDEKWKGKSMLELGLLAVMYQPMISIMTLGIGWVVRQFL